MSLANPAVSFTTEDIEATILTSASHTHTISERKNTGEEPVQSSTESVETPVPLSKNAQKRLLKAEKRQAQKLERRAKEKAKRKENKRARAVEAAAEGHEPPVKKPRLLPKPFGACIVIDLGFDDLMSDKVIHQIR